MNEAMPTLVNRVVVPDAEIRREAAHVNACTVDEKREEAARRLAIRELLRQRAEALGIATREHPGDAIDELLEREVSVQEPDETACRRYFEQNRDRFCTPREVEMRHILLAAAPDDVEGRERARTLASSLIAELGTAPGRFAELAAAHSRCPSAASGGALGTIGKGQTVPELENVALRLGVGLAERPVETRYGFHVVEVLGRRGGVPLAYDDVRHLVRDYLREQRWRQALKEYLGRLVDQAEFSGIEWNREPGPLTQ